MIVLAMGPERTSCTHVTFPAPPVTPGFFAVKYNHKYPGNKSTDREKIRELHHAQHTTSHHDLYRLPACRSSRIRRLYRDREFRKQDHAAHTHRDSGPGKPHCRDRGTGQRHRVREAGQLYHRYAAGESHHRLPVESYHNARASRDQRHLRVVGQDRETDGRRRDADLGYHGHCNGSTEDQCGVWPIMGAGHRQRDRVLDDGCC